FCQLLLAIVLFWVEAISILIVYGGGVLAWESYGVYSAVILVGLLLETLSNKRLQSSTPHRDFFEAHFVAIRQTLFSGGLLLLYVVATKDTTISRMFVAI